MQRATTMTLPTQERMGAGDVGLLVCLAGIWGFTFLLIELAVETLTPLWIVALRTLTGFGVLYVALRLNRATLPAGRDLWGHLVLLAGIGNVLPWTLVAWAQQTITSGLTVVLYSLIPVMTLVISVLASLERWTLRRIMGLVMATAGTVIVVGVNPANSRHLGPVLLVLGACASLAAGAVYAKRYITPRLRPMPMATGQLGVSVAASTVLAVLVDGFPTREDLKPSVILAVVLLGVLATGAAFLIFYTLIERVGATNATFVTYLTPVIGLLAGWLILDEALQPSLFVGCAVIIAGIWLSQQPAAVRKATA